MRNLWGLKEVCRYHSSVAYNDISKVAIFGTKDDPYECDASTNLSHPCASKMAFISLHISSFGKAAPVILKLMGIISTAITPILPSEARNSSFSLISAKNLAYG